MECDNCQRGLTPTEPVIIWYHQRRADLCPGYAQTHGCQSCVDEALNVEIASRGFSLRHAFRVLSGKPKTTARPSWCARCNRSLYVVTATPYKETYSRSYFCSDHCRTASRPAQKQIACEVCEASFTPKRADAKTCSPACRQRAYRSRLRAGASLMP